MSSGKRQILSVTIIVVIAWMLALLLHPTNILLANNATPTPSSYVRFPSPLGAERYFACPDEIVIGAGPTWHGIEIGITELQEIENRFRDSFGLENVSIEVIYETAATQYMEFGRLLLCVQHATVVVLRTAPEMPNLLDFVAIYGTPDTVTWTPTYNTRIAFWFEHGIAVEILTYTAEMTDLSWGMVMSVIYFPYQEIDDFEQRWPYNATEPQMPNLAGIGDFVPTQQNPFDFDAIAATVTAQPTRTPTPTPSITPDKGQ